MLVGDAARQVDPLTGGGIMNAMAAGAMAAEVAAGAVSAGDVSAAFLGGYEERLQRTIGRKLRRNYRIRKKFPPQRRTDERFTRAFALAVGG
jgi:digeranylgeranylglycerophospholipid reductase